MSKKEIMVCPHCGSKELKQKIWIDLNAMPCTVNTSEIDYDPDEVWCDGCEEYVNPNQNPNILRGNIKS